VITIAIGGFYNELLHYGNPVRDWMLKSKLHPYTLRLLGAVAVVIWFEVNGIVNRIFSSHPLRFIGRISFPYYLVHGIIFAMVGASILNRLIAQGWSSVAAGLEVALPVCLLTSLISVYLYTIICDEPSIKAANNFARTCEAK